MKHLWGLVCLASVAGCASPKHLSLDLPRSEVAEIRGIDQESGSFGLNPPEYHVHFQAIDGLDLQGRFENGLPRSIEVHPGERELRCWYAVKPMGEPVRLGTRDVRVSVQAGHVYQMTIEWSVIGSMRSTGEFVLELRDITEQLRHTEESEAARRRELRNEAAGRLDPY